MTAHLPVIVLGAGGHAMVVAEALLSAGIEVLGFTDADAGQKGRLLCGMPILGADAELQGFRTDQVRLANGIGSVRNESMSLRRKVQTQLESEGWIFVSVVHADARVSRFAKLGPCVQLMAGCVVQAGAELGAAVIVNTSAVVDHGVRLGAWSHVATGAIVCGDVTIGDASHVGAGAVVRQGLTLGPNSLIGIGAAVVADFPGEGTLTGVPARPIELHS